MEKIEFIEIGMISDMPNTEVDVGLRLDEARGWVCTICHPDSLVDQVCVLLANHKIDCRLTEDGVKFALGPQSPWGAIAMVQAVFQEPFNLQPPMFWYLDVDSKREFNVQTRRAGRHRVTVAFEGDRIRSADTAQNIHKFAAAIRRSGLCVAAEPNTAVCHVELTAAATANAHDAYRALVALHPSLR